MVSPVDLAPFERCSFGAELSADHSQTLAAGERSQLGDKRHEICRTGITRGRLGHLHLIDQVQPVLVTPEVRKGGLNKLERGRHDGAERLVHSPILAESSRFPPARYRGGVIATTIWMDTVPDLVALGARTGLLWSRDGMQLAGLGEAFRIELASLDDLNDASAELTTIGSDPASTATGPGTGAVAFGALPFNRQEAGALVVPEILLGRAPDGRRWMTVVAADEASVDLASAFQQISAVGNRPVPDGPEPTSFDLVSTLSPAIWRDEVVGFAKSRIVAGDLNKAVMARELVLRTDHPIDTAQTLDRLRRSYPTAILFSIDGFIGASPELLVSRTDRTVRAHPLAGTAPRSSDPAEDQRMAQSLLGSSKDRAEHRITIDWLLDTLLPFCSFVDAEPEPTIVSLANVHHLGTRVEGRLSTPPASVLELVGALHPTPAVGGQPQAKALELISALERMDRNRYAGPTGWVDSAGNGEFAVGIRSAQIRGAEARIWAGVGVVEHSDPAAELAETRSKFQAMLSALVRP